MTASEFSEGPGVVALIFAARGQWAVDAVIATQTAFAPADEFLVFVSEATNPASVLHYLVPLLTLWDPPLAIQALAAYVIGDTTNLMLKWPAMGDRPYWMDPRVRQFGSSTCEVGWGMPSGHMQVTVAVYAVLAYAFRRAWFTACIAALVLITAVSRVHMGAHTPLQVGCGLLAGVVTAWVVVRMRPGIRRWCSREMGHQARARHALAAAAAIVAIIVAEHAALEAAGLEPSKSVAKATAACRGGVHGTVATGKGIARDTGALLGAAAGRWVYYSNAPRNVLASKDAGKRLPWWALALLWGVSALASLRALTAVEVAGVAAAGGGAAGQAAEAALSGLKYLALLALATGGWATLIGTTKSSVLSERALSFRDEGDRVVDE